MPYLYDALLHKPLVGKTPKTPQVEMMQHWSFDCNYTRQHMQYDTAFVFIRIEE